jgi:isopentenyl-diphosphate delta-isomerase type 1
MNPEEIFDVVDANDRVTGRLPRSEVHRLGLRHRATHVLVFNSRGELFVQQRALTKDMWPGVWDSSCSGHVDGGEEYDACAARELGEELGLPAGTRPERWFRLEATPESGMEFCWVYRLSHEGPFRLQESEVRGGGWFSPASLHSWIQHRPGDFASAFLVIWRELLPRGILVDAAKPD